MNLRKYQLIFLLLILLGSVSTAAAETAPAVLQQTVSQTLDLWREAQYERLYESLSHRGKTSKEQFVERMREASRRPACCWQKLENFRVIEERRKQATVYAKVGLEGTPSPVESCTREFKLSLEGGEWRMQLNDVLYLAGLSGKKVKNHRKKSYGRI